VVVVEEEQEEVVKAEGEEEEEDETKKKKPVQKRGKPGWLVWISSYNYIHVFDCDCSRRVGTTRMSVVASGYTYSIDSTAISVVASGGQGMRVVLSDRRNVPHTAVAYPVTAILNLVHAADATVRARVQLRQYNAVRYGRTHDGTAVPLSKLYLGTAARF
jgi:hypothetical protein